MPIDIQGLQSALDTLKYEDENEGLLDIEMQRMKNILGHEPSVDEIQQMRSQTKKEQDTERINIHTSKKKSEEKEQEQTNQAKDVKQGDSRWADLISAIKKGDWENAASILSSNINPLTGDDTAGIQDAIDALIREDQPKLLEMILDKSDAEPHDESITYAIEEGRDAIVKVLVRKRKDAVKLDGFALALAIMSKKQLIANILLKSDTLNGNEVENMALRVAAGNKDKAMTDELLKIRSVTDGLVEAMDLLIDEGEKDAITFLVQNEKVIHQIKSDESQEAADLKKRLADELGSVPDVKTFLGEVGSVKETLDFERFAASMHS